MPIVDLGDVSLFHTDRGAGAPTILFVHGLACDGEDWIHQLPAFGDHRVVTVDLRGHGQSSAPDMGYDPPNLARDVAALLDRLATGPVVAIGHSLGGVVVSALAIERPDLVTAVVAVDPGYGVPAPFAAHVPALIASFDGDGFVAGASAMFTSTEGPATPAHLREWHQRRIERVRPHVFRQAFAGLFEGPGALAIRPRCDEYLTARRCPVLAFYARASQAGCDIELLTEPPSRAVVWEGSGHWLHQERPAEFNAVVRSWIGSLV